MKVAGGESLVRLSFEADVIYWRGPSPYFFIGVPPQEAAELRAVARAVTYGWGMIPVGARIGDVAFTTSLFPRDQTYLLPLKSAVRDATNVTAGDTVGVELTLQVIRR
jgi:hypothetical protein